MCRVFIMISFLLMFGGLKMSIAADQVVRVNAIDNKVINVTDLQNKQNKVLRLSPRIQVKIAVIRDNSIYHLPATLRDVRPGVKVIAIAVDYDTVYDIVIER